MGKKNPSSVLWQSFKSPTEEEMTVMHLETLIQETQDISDLKVYKSFHICFLMTHFTLQK